MRIVMAALMAAGLAGCAAQPALVVPTYETVQTLQSLDTAPRPKIDAAFYDLCAGHQRAVPQQGNCACMVKQASRLDDSIARLMVRALSTDGRIIMPDNLQTADNRITIRMTYNEWRDLCGLKL